MKKEITTSLDERKTHLEGRREDGSTERWYYTCARDPNWWDSFTVLVSVHISELKTDPDDDSEAIERLAAARAREKADDAFRRHDRAKPGA